MSSPIANAPSRISRFPNIKSTVIPNESPSRPNIDLFTIIVSSENEYSSLLIFELPSSSFYFSTTTVLHIDMFNLDDCISLIDGRLKQLTTFIVRVHAILLLTSS
ncbi:unnamed protein product [Rotaria magnacalcarata]|uniref:Uncharacterized protein n=1 Tax=Rotaria magnacalcarata TaxID=392030 RepID=A0A819Z5W6_9BILA|nr:unnamed protein product [Rotaria magnacalcarata]CAF1675091.1 unnamed protein product [Rotaria magnacalcarata]CAF1987125.1 unnamed protein product [Rotaria magnacalcarata]CAF2118159.1 unnamed protein product [Rotaria magnacalcarata]CAF3990335.1 unnamed protein product [Rotaria magnacalcarata]